MPRKNGLLRPFPKDLTDRAKVATAMLVTAIAAPFPNEVWKDVRTSVWLPHELSHWAKETPGDPFDTLLEEVFSPWTKLADRLTAVDDGTAAFERELRSLLPMLLAAQTINSPFLYLTTIVGCYPSLHALWDFAVVVPFESVAFDVEGTWVGNFFYAVSKSESIFREVFRLPVE